MTLQNYIILAQCLCLRHCVVVDKKKHVSREIIQISKSLTLPNLDCNSVALS